MSKSKTKYKQCRIERENTHTTVWLPTKYAKQGSTISVKKDEEWDEGWFVAEVYPMEIDDTMAISFRDAWRYQRGVSDI